MKESSVPGKDKIAEAELEIPAYRGTIPAGSLARGDPA